MPKNKSNIYQSSKTPGKFESNKPNYSKPVLPPIEGEIIELQKRHYGQGNINELLDRSFSEITKTRERISPDNFFNLYQELFYDIPKQGKRSHTFLIEESTKYIGGYEDPIEDKIQNLLDKIVDLGFTQIHASNTLPTDKGGLSGKVLLPYTKRIIEYLKSKYNHVEVIAGGGIQKSWHAEYYKNLGADHISIGTACFNPYKVWKIVNKNDF